MSSQAANLTPQLARLFYGAGLLRGTEAQAEEGRQKSIMQILRQDVSLDSFMELLTADVPVPKLGGRPSEALHDGLVNTTHLNQAEMQSLLIAIRPELLHLSLPLVRTGLLDSESFVSATEQAEERGADVYQWLTSEGVLTAAMIGKMLNDPSNDPMVRASIVLCLHLLAENGKLEREQAESWMASLVDEDRETLAMQISEGLGTEKTLEQVTSDGELRLPGWDLQASPPEDALLARFPQSFVRRQMIVPLDERDGQFAFLTSDPLNVPKCCLLSWLTGRWALPYFMAPRELIDVINAHYAPLEATPEASPVAPRVSVGGTEVREPVAQIQTPESKPTSQTWASVESEPESPLDNTSAVQLVSSIIENAIALRTTDIHLEPQEKEMRVRFRVDGNLHRIMTVPPALVQSVNSRIKVLANMDVTERRRPQDGHFELKVAENHFDFRISTLPVNMGEKIVIRILEAARVITGLGEIGLNEAQLKEVEKLIQRPNGMFLVTGPTGSGKTSTLYAALNTINDEKRNLVTIEDPVEYQLPGINQMQVDNHIGMSFSQGLRSVLRQDPDVIMVGEIRDSDTARIAIRAALTGHLVFSTLHTNSALGAIEALLHLDAIPFMLANSLTGIVSQRLVKLLCPHCRKERRTNKMMNLQLGLSERSRRKVNEPVGCEECLNTGYRGRTGIFEVVTVNDPVRRAIATYETPHELETCVREQGMKPLAEAGIEKVLAGESSLEEVMRHVMLEN